MSNFRELTFSPLNPDIDVDDIETFTFQSYPTPLEIDDDRQATGEEGNNVPASPSASPNANLQSGQSTVLGATFNFVNSIVGAGIIGIPYAIQQCGFVLGMLMLLAVAILIYKSVVLLIEAGIKYNKYNLEELSEHLLGRTGYYIATSSMFLFAFGGMVAYLVIVGDTLPLVLEYFFGESMLTNRSLVTVLCATLVILPLCLKRDLSALSFTSMLSILADVILIVLIVIASYAPHSSSSVGHSIALQDLLAVDIQLFAGLGTMSFAFVCQHNSFLVFKSLRQPTLANWKAVSALSISFAYVLCLSLGCIGYFTYFPDIQGDVLNNLPPCASATMARLLLCASMLCTYPMELVVARHCWGVWRERWRKSAQGDRFGLKYWMYRLFGDRKGTGKVGVGIGHHALDAEDRTEGDIICFDEHSEEFWQSTRTSSRPSQTHPSTVPSTGYPWVSFLSSWINTTPSNRAIHRVLSAHIQIQVNPLQATAASDAREEGFEEVPLSPPASPASSPSSPRRLRRGSGQLQQQLQPIPSETQNTAISSPIQQAESISHDNDESKTDGHDNVETGNAVEEMSESLITLPYLHSHHAPSSPQTHNTHVNALPQRHDSGDVDAEGEQEETLMSSRELVLSTLVLWGLTLFLSLVAGGLGEVSALTGVAAASTLGYTLPSLVTLLSPPRPKGAQLFLPITLLVVGVVALVVGVTVVLSGA
eukprot:gene25179-30411_t